MRPSVAAVVLSYNGREVTLQALESLTAMEYEPYELAVVDNGSSDGTAAAVAEAFPAVGVLRLEENHGPAAGANHGIRWALAKGHDYVLVLNNDIEVASDMLTRMVEVAESDPAIGCVGPMGYYHDDRARIWSAGGRIVFREAVTKERGQGELDRGQYDRGGARGEEIDYVNGCAQLTKRECFERAGLWDPIYHLSVEDADFCMRIRRLGYRCHFAPRAKLWHMVSVSTGGYRPAKTFQTGRSTAIFVRRYARPWQWLTVLFFLAIGMPAAYLRELSRGNQRAVVAKMRGFVEGFRIPLPPPPRLEEEEERSAPPRRAEPARA